MPFKPLCTTPEDLIELNPKTVQLKFTQNLPNLEELQNFDLIVIADLKLNMPKFLKTLNRNLLKHPPKILLAVSCGQLGYLRLCLGKNQVFFVENCHREHLLPDMRLDLPSKEYLDYVNSFQLDDKKSDLNKIPFPVFISKILQEMPDSDISKIDKNVVKQKLKKISPEHHESIQQAISKVNKYVRKYEIPESIRELVDLAKNYSFDLKNNPFEICLRGLVDYWGFYFLSEVFWRLHLPKPGT